MCYHEISLGGQKKEIMGFHHKFYDQEFKCQTISHKSSFRMNLFEHGNVLALSMVSTLISNK